MLEISYILDLHHSLPCAAFAVPGSGENPCQAFLNKVFQMMLRWISLEPPKMVEARQSPMLVMREMQAYSVGITEEVDRTVAQMRKGLRVAPTRSAGAAPSPTASAPSSLTGLKSPPKPIKVSSKATSRGRK